MKVVTLSEDVLVIIIQEEIEEGNVEGDGQKKEEVKLLEEEDLKEDAFQETEKIAAL